MILIKWCLLLEAIELWPVDAHLIMTSPELYSKDPLMVEFDEGVKVLVITSVDSRHGRSRRRLDDRRVLGEGRHVE